MDDIFAEATARERRLFDQLAACPVVEVTGVVGVNGVAAAQYRGEELLCLDVTFDAWRVGSGPLKDGPLTVRRRVTDEEFRSWRGRIRPETVVKIRARVAEENVFGTPQALIEEFVGRDPADMELHEVLGELKKPVTHQDGFFGTFAFDRRVGWYTTSATWNGEPVDLDLSVDGPDEVDAALKVARALWEDQAAWNRRVRDHAVRYLLDLKNNVWLEEDEAELTAEQFEGRMKLESITIHPDGGFKFWHDDGDLFLGHCIEVSGNLSDGPTHAGIPG